MHTKFNGLQALEATIVLPLLGPWTATAELDASTAIEGTVAITIGDMLTFAGTSRQSGVYGGRVQLRMTAGAGRQQESIEGKCYARCTAGLPLREIVTAVGDSLSATSDAALLGYQLRHWVRARNPARRELELLLSRIGATWRSLPDGSAWVGSETWPASALVDGYTVTDRNEAQKRLEIACDLPNVFPGEMFDGRRVTGVEHRISGPRLRTMVTYA